VGTPQRFVGLLEHVNHSLTSPTIVIGLESVPAPLCVVDIVRYAKLRPGGGKLAFSLDLQGGQPLTNVAMWKSEPPINIVRWIISAGIQRLIVLDLADVGVGRGTGTLALCRQVRHECPELELIAGGGVRSVDDLKALADAGCSAALVASSLHDGRLSAEDVRRVMQS
jgi:phosphoribosylformimino-5-aminoimidazole carboxamide ribotide isomerase